VIESTTNEKRGGPVKSLKQILQSRELNKKIFSLAKGKDNKKTRCNVTPF